MVLVCVVSELGDFDFEVLDVSGLDVEGVMFLGGSGLGGSGLGGSGLGGSGNGFSVNMVDNYVVVMKKFLSEFGLGRIVIVEVDGGEFDGYLLYLFVFYG